MEVLYKLAELYKKEGESIMKTLKASEARIPTETFNRVVYNGERVKVEHRSAGAVVLIPEKDYEDFRLWEDMRDAQEAKRALKSFEKSGKKAVPYSEVRKEAGLA